MTIRRFIAPMLYAQAAPGRWLSGPTTAMEEAAASMCRLHWQQGRSREVRIVRTAPPPYGRR